MNISKLLGRWTLTSAPFKCRPKILSEIIIDFHENGRASIYDTANSSHCSYTVTFNEDNTTGILNFKCSGWTKRGRLWNTNDEVQEAALADNFIHSLIRNPISFESNNILKIKHLDALYEFSN